MAKNEKEAARPRNKMPRQDDRRESTRERLQFIRRASEKRESEHRSGVHAKR